MEADPRLPHEWTLTEYDALHTMLGIGPWWMTSDRREETAAEIAAGVGPLGLRTLDTGRAEV